MDKGLICVPPDFCNYISDRYEILFDHLIRFCNFSIEYTETPNVEGFDVVLLYNSPCYTNPYAGMNVLNKDVKIISYIVDVHASENRKIYQENMNKVLDRADIVLSASIEALYKEFPRCQDMDNIVFFPNFLQPYYLDLPFNITPRKKCLLSGCIDDFYPLRQYMKRELDNDFCDILPHPGYRGFENHVVHEDYGKLLNSYYACITSSGLAHYVTGKHIEIMGSGALLLSDRVEDFHRMGFIPYRHYVPIDAQHSDVVKIRMILSNRDTYDYDVIRATGRKKVRKEFTVHNAFDKLKGILNEL